MALTDAQHALRRTGMSASDIAAVVGMDPYRSAHDVYLEKVDGVRFGGNHHTERGEHFEPGVASWYAKRTGYALREVGTVAHPSLAGVLCTPDRLAKTPDGGELDLSIKVPWRGADRGWGAPGTDEVPTQYLLQVQWELFVLEPLCGITRAQLAMVGADGDLVLYSILRDTELQGQLVESAQRFMVDHVQRRIPPPVDGSEGCSRWLARAFPRERIAMLAADPDLETLAQRYRNAELAMKEAAAQRDALENAIKARLGDSEGVEGAFGRILWRRSKDGLKTDWKAVAAEAKAPPDIIKKHTRPTEGSRRFLTYWSEE